MNEDEIIDLHPTHVSIRYGQSDSDPYGYLTEAFRVELATDRGPFAIVMPPTAMLELAQHLLASYNQLSDERAEWAARRQDKQ